jgi:hypothetical protein
MLRPVTRCAPRTIGSLAALALFWGAGPAAGQAVSETRVAAEFAELEIRAKIRAAFHLERYEGFLPFGYAYKDGGNVSFYVGEKARDADSIDEVALEVASGLRLVASRGDVRAVCMVVLVRSAPPGQAEKVDTVWLRLEHVGGVSKSVFHPYETTEGGTVEYRDSFSIVETPTFFPPNPR